MLTSSFLSVFKTHEKKKSEVLLKISKGNVVPTAKRWALLSFGYVLMHRAHGTVCRDLLSPGAVSQSEVTAPPKTKQTLVPALRWPPPTSPGLSQTKHRRNELEGCWVGLSLIELLKVPGIEYLVGNWTCFGSLRHLTSHPKGFFSPKEPKYVCLPWILFLHLTTMMTWM